MARNASQPITRFLELEALQEAVRWPDPSVQTIVTLASQLLATHHDQDGYAYFRERAASRPDQPLFLALEGLFQARLTDGEPLLRRPGWVKDAFAKLDRAVAQAPGLTTYLRGLVLADLPGLFGKAKAAVADLEWTLAHKEQFPIGLRRGLYRGLARAYPRLGRAAEGLEALRLSGYATLDDGPLFTTDSWLTAEDGFHFVAPRLVELSPRVYVAQGYDFGDFAFVLTDNGVVAIDAGTADAHARAALAELRTITSAPISHVILTHAHWDHVGGLEGLRGPDTRVVAQAGFADELRIVNDTAIPFPAFFAGSGQRRHAVEVDQTVDAATTLNIGGVDFELYPVSGGETMDGLLIQLPGSGVVFCGDVFMPYLGAPFLPEGSVDGLLDTIGLIRRLEPRLLIHGHAPLTANFTVDALPGLEAALRELYVHVLEGIRQARTLTDVLHDNRMPTLLREHPAAVIPYLLMRNNLIQRAYHQRTGYWKSDGEGMEHFAPAEWAAALDLLADLKERAFVRGATSLMERGDHALALRLIEPGLLRHPGSRDLATLRRQALDRLRERYQLLDPFKFIVYSHWAAAELSLVS